MSNKQVKKQAVDALSRLIDAAKELVTIEENLRRQSRESKGKQNHHHRLVRVRVPLHLKPQRYDQKNKEKNQKPQANTKPAAIHQRLLLLMIFIRQRQCIKRPAREDPREIVNGAARRRIHCAGRRRLRPRPDTGPRRK